MRERVSYIIRDPSSFHPNQFEVSKTSFAVSKLDAIKEHQIILDPEQLPSDLWRVLRNCHELHVRWSTHRPYETVAPFVSRIPPGLHISYTPLQNRTVKRLCSLIKEVFGSKIKCESVEEAFSTPNVISERFASSASKQFYSFVPAPRELSYWIQKNVCGEDSIPCRLRAHDLQTADYFDFDYDAVSQSIKLTALWTKANGDDGLWYETLLKGSNVTDKLEVGVLMNETPEDVEELRYSGFLTQVGKDTSPAPTLFSFPARHHPFSSFTFHAVFPPPNGLHPILSLSFSSAPKPPNDNEDCALHAYFILPSAIFLDKYAFSDTLLLNSHGLKGLRGLSGETDLEAPEWVVKAWGSAALFELDPRASDDWNVTVPLHTRYLPPQESSHVLLPVPFPAVFWACPADNSGGKFAVAPFDRTSLGYDGIFGGNTLFYHVPPAPFNVGGKAVATLKVPVLDTDQAEFVGAGTVGVIVLGMLWIMWKLWTGVWRKFDKQPKKTSKDTVAETPRTRARTRKSAKTE